MGECPPQTRVGTVITDRSTQMSLTYGSSAIQELTKFFVGHTGGDGSDAAVADMANEPYNSNHVLRWSNSQSVPDLHTLPTGEYVNLPAILIASSAYENCVNVFREVAVGTRVTPLYETLVKNVIERYHFFMVGSVPATDTPYYFMVHRSGLQMKHDPVMEVGEVLHLTGRVYDNRRMQFYAHAIVKGSL